MKRWLVEDLQRGTSRVVEAESWYGARVLFVEEHDGLTLGTLRFAGGEQAAEAFVMSPRVRCTPASP